MAEPDPIGSYGLLGDTRTAALVDSQGSIDWLCLPHFDGDPVFARLLAGPDGGHFAVRPAGPAELIQRRYRPETAVLESAWAVGSAQLIAADGLIADVDGSPLPTFCLVRRVEAHGRPVRVHVSFEPRAGPSRRHYRERATSTGTVYADGSTALWLSADPPVVIRPGSVTEVEVEPSRPLTIVLTAAHRGPLTLISPTDAWTRAAGRRRPLPAVVRRHRVRGARCRGRHPQPHHAAPAHLRAGRRAGRRGDDVAARVARGRSQLGLPVRLAP